MARDHFEFTVAKRIGAAIVLGDQSKCSTYEIGNVYRWKSAREMATMPFDPYDVSWTYFVEDCQSYGTCEVTGEYGEVSDIALVFHFTE